MALTAKIDYTKYTDAIRTIEAHTEGEYCRVALDCPKTEGNTMIERKHYLEEHYDYLRTALMFEPRGHHDMFGAFVVEPCNKEADFGRILHGWWRIPQHVRSLHNWCCNSNP